MAFSRCPTCNSMVRVEQDPLGMSNYVPSRLDSIYETAVLLVKQQEKDADLAEDPSKVLAGLLALHNILMDR